jgi:EAL domain-containing protein (putative c-di-GMP-specific phosphodiesterase class I)
MVRGSDVVARPGSDEFVVVLTDIGSPDEAANFASRVNEAFKQPFTIGDGEHFVHLSVGLAVFPHDGEHVDKLVSAADMAMLLAKKDGGNTHRFYTPSMQKDAALRFSLESDLHRALANDEFLVYYQPYSDTMTGELLGVEALIRWNDPMNGMRLPLDFIGCAEEIGLIVPMGQFVLAQAIRQAKRLEEIGRPLRVSVNVSARQFRDSTLAEHIARLLREHALAADSLQLEITESALVDRNEGTIAALARLREMGVAIAIDDFGTGYSSMAYLRDLPVDTLKIDRSFIGDISHDRFSRAITAAIVNLAHSLGLGVVVEGIETPEQMRIIRLLRCDAWQGFYLSKPMPAEELERFLDVRERVVALKNPPLVAP